MLCFHGHLIDRLNILCIKLMGYMCYIYQFLYQNNINESVRTQNNITCCGYLLLIKKIKTFQRLNAQFNIKYGTWTTHVTCLYICYIRGIHVLYMFYIYMWHTCYIYIYMFYVNLQILF